MLSSMITIYYKYPTIIDYHVIFDLNLNFMKVILNIFNIKFLYRIYYISNF